MPLRLGGDELGVLLAGASETDALAVAQDILDQLNERNIKASIGVIQLDLSATLAANLEDADAAMYAAKDLGGNQVVGYSQLINTLLPIKQST